jgi:hypothetical protein
MVRFDTIDIDYCAIALVSMLNFLSRCSLRSARNRFLGLMESPFSSMAPSLITRDGAGLFVSFMLGECLSEVDNVDNSPLLA